MGKRDKRLVSEDDLLSTLTDFTSKENWDKFFTIRRADDSFEWYAEWPQLHYPLLSLLTNPSSTLRILVPGCGSSRLSEHLYDAGFQDITNIDFSKVVISDMLRRNVRERPDMRWRIMDMTSMQFTDETFDVVLDKGGLDALMEPEHGSEMGIRYLSEVKRVLKSGGKFICLTLAESHVLDVFFPKFRFGWKVTIDAIPQKPSSKPSLQTFMVVAKKENSTMLQRIALSFNQSSIDCNRDQAVGLHEALEKENQMRNEYASGSDVLYSLEDLQLGAKGDLTTLSQGRRCQLTLGVQGGSRFLYKAILLDAKQQMGPFSYNCGVFIVPKLREAIHEELVKVHKTDQKYQIDHASYFGLQGGFQTRAHEWLFSLEEGQWMVVESSKAARLIMVVLDMTHTSASMDDIQKDLSPLVKSLAPGKEDNGAQIPFMMASDRIKQRKKVHQVISPLTGPIVIEDVVYEEVDVDVSHHLPSKDVIFRRLIFQRTESLVQSEALLFKKESSQKITGGGDKKRSSSSAKAKRKGSQKRNEVPSNGRKVYHDYLASSYHTGIVSGFMLVSSYLESVISAGKAVKAVVIGLGAGLLPMFLRGCMPFLHTQVVELDAVILDLAKDYFSFTEDACLKVHIADGIQLVKELTNYGADEGLSVASRKEDDSGDTKSSSDGNYTQFLASGRGSTKVDILVIDVDSGDSSSGITCPAADFIEESFLLTVKDVLSEEGLFVINLVSRSSAAKDMVISRMKVVFSHLFCLQLEEDVNLVLFGVCSELSIKEDWFAEAASRFEKLLKFKHPEVRKSIMEASRKIRCLK